MTTTRCLQKKFLTLTLLASSIAGVGCGSAEAMGRGPSTPANATPVPLVVIAPPVIGGGDFDDGYQLGLRNGGLLVDRLKQRTTDELGCDAIDQLESALLKVTRTVRPPLAAPGAPGLSDWFVKGFYTGYTDSVRGTLREVRGACDYSSYSSGEFAGQLYGAVACQVQTLSSDALIQLQLQPLYSGWSGGSSSVLSTCRASLLQTIESCSNGADLSAEIQASLSISCSDG